MGKGVNLSSITTCILLLKAMPEKNDRVEVDRLKQVQDALFPQKVIQGFKTKLLRIICLERCSTAVIKTIFRRNEILFILLVIV